VSGVEFNPEMPREKLAEVIKAIDSYLSERDKVREEAIRLSRDVVRSAGWAVTAVHKGNMEEARAHLSEAEEKTRRLLEITRPYPELYYSGMVYNAVSEYVEARVFIDIITGRGLPGPDELGVQPVPYLQGLGDVVGELRRLALEMVRRDRFDVAWRLLEAMEQIYLQLRGLDYPDALAPGVRRKADAARRLVDDTKALLVDLENRYKLTMELRRVRGSQQ
jgi:translin